MSYLQDLDVNYEMEDMDVQFMGCIFDHILVFGCRSKFNKNTDTVFEPETYYLYNTENHNASKCFRWGIPHIDPYEKLRRYDFPHIPQKDIDYDEIYDDYDVIYLPKEHLLIFQADAENLYTTINTHTMGGLYDSEYRYSSSTDNYHIFKQEYRKPYETQILTKWFKIHERDALDGRWISGDELLVCQDDKYNIYNLKSRKYRFPIGEKHRIKIYGDIIEIDGRFYIRKMQLSGHLF